MVPYSVSTLNRDMDVGCQSSGVLAAEGTPWPTGLFLSWLLLLSTLFLRP